MFINPEVTCIFQRIKIISLKMEEKEKEKKRGEGE